MKKEDYKLTMQSFQNQISDIRKRQEDLKNHYIDVNKKFDIDQKVKVFFSSNSEVGIVTGYEIGYDDEVRYIVNKIKKNGEKSQHKIWMFGIILIEPVSKIINPPFPEKIDFNQITNIVTDGKGVDVFIMSADYKGEEMTDAQIDYINEFHSEFIQEHLLLNQ